MAYVPMHRFETAMRKGIYGVYRCNGNRGDNVQEVFKKLVGLGNL